MRCIKKNAGFVLVELIIVTVILGAVFPLSVYFIDAMKAARETKIQQTANHLAQKYMEDYKQKDLEAIAPLENEEPSVPSEEIINGRSFYVSVATEQFLVPVENENWIGNVEIANSSTSGITIQMGNSSSGVTPGEAYTLRISELIMELLNATGDQLCSAAITLPVDGEPELNLFITNNPRLTLNVENTLDKKLIINKAEKKNADGSEANPDFALSTKQGKVEIRDDESVEGYKRGVNIIVTVKDQDDEVLAEVAQTRLIEWVSSQK
ncbi:MAG: type IV pilus modification PilV family protein [Peptococcia bacterium]|jgi:type II secretory pathway pseudopilin PulG